MGFSTDVFTAPGHPGFPQDSDLLEHNDFYSNNFNAYLPLCPVARSPGPNGPNQGCSDVTPTEPVPVGTGMWIAGGNANIVRNNRFWDNWRRGAMLFQVPDAFVCDDPNNQMAGCDPTATVRPPRTATSSTTTRWGGSRTAAPQPNGVDFWWDQGGISVDPTLNTGGTAGTATPGRTAPREASPASLPSGAPPEQPAVQLRHSPSVGAMNGQVAELLTCSTVPKATRAARGSQPRQSRSPSSQRSGPRLRGGACCRRRSRGRMWRRIRHPAPGRRRAQRRPADQPGGLQRLEPGEHRAAPRDNSPAQGLRRRPGGREQRLLSVGDRIRLGRQAGLRALQQLLQADFARGFKLYKLYERAAAFTGQPAQ